MPVKVGRPASFLGRCSACRNEARVGGAKECLVRCLNTCTIIIKAPFDPVSITRAVVTPDVLEILRWKQTRAVVAIQRKDVIGSFGNKITLVGNIV